VIPVLARVDVALVQTLNVALRSCGGELFIFTLAFTRDHTLCQKYFGFFVLFSNYFLSPRMRLANRMSLT
jgi:hypothetical protein